MKIAFDVMGFDNNINEAISAAKKFKKIHNDCELVLVGKKEEIRYYLEDNEFAIHNANDVISMEDLPLAAIRKTQSSMYQAIKLLADNKVDGVISAGNTACYIALLFILIRPIKGINKPGFMPFAPTTKNKPIALIDVGANLECDGYNLFQFAKMAQLYFKYVLNNNHPKIGIINIGTEEHKGFKYHQDASKLISEDKTLDYYGYIEPRYLLDGLVDIAVCDGYTGNIALKAMEGGLLAINSVLKRNFKKPYNWLGALFSLGAIKSVKNTFDYKKHAAAIVIGLNKPAVKTHGSAHQMEFIVALDVTYKYIKSNLINNLKKEFEHD